MLDTIVSEIQREWPTYLVFVMVALGGLDWLTEGLFCLLSRAKKKT